MARLKLQSLCLVMHLGAAGCLANSPSGSAAADGAASTDGGVAVGANPTSVTGPIGSPDHLPSMRACVQAHTPKPRGLRRLTGLEVSRTLADIFGAADVPDGTEAFGGDTTVYQFDTIQSVLTMTQGSVTALQVYSEAVGSYAAAHLGTLSPCTTQDGNCRGTFLTQFGKKMFRRPLASEELVAYDGLMAAPTNFSDGVKVVVSAMVQSPYFIYRPELGTPDPAQPSRYILGPYEIAQALSYTLTGRAPDAALMAAADAGALGDANARMVQAERLIQTLPAKDTLGRFVLQWLQVESISSAARTEGSLTLSPDIKAAMREEVWLAVQDVLNDANSLFSAFFTTPTTYLNGDLASFYGSSLGGDPTFVATPTVAIHRDAGVLGMGGVLASASQTNIASPTLRGRMLRMRMLCGSIPSPPNSVPPIAANAGTTSTIRATYVQHTNNPACAGCHTAMDPLGYTMGNYDTLGRRRPGDMENNSAVDTSGKVTGVGDTDVPLSGLSDLSTYLAHSDEAGACFARHWAMYALGAVSWAQDRCTFDDLAQVARAANYNVQATLLGLIAMPTFALRSADP